MDIISEEEVEKIALASFLAKNSEPESWVILYKGRMIKLDSGKSVWAKKQHASSALTNHLHSALYRKNTGWKPSDVNQMLQAKGIIEIKKL